MIPIIFSLISALGWGLFPVFDKKALQLIDNNIYILFIMKIFIASILTIFFYLFINKKINIKIKKINTLLIYLLLSVITGLFIGHLCYAKALSKSKNPTIVILITYTIPIIFFSILSSIIFKEQFNCYKIIGLVLSIIGIGIFVYFD